MKTNKLNLLETLPVTILFALLFFIACGKSETSVTPTPEPNPGVSNLDGSLVAGDYIADYSKAKENVLRAIPKKYMDVARNQLQVAYQHTSHGTHVTRGLFGLKDYKVGDNTLFAITNNNPATDKLAFFDNFAGWGDLSADETMFIAATRQFLDDPKNANVNVIMWSWCDITGHDVAKNYLPGMKQLISEYGKNGTKKRAKPVYFVFMTGHAVGNANIGDGKPKNQADLITNFCKENKQLCLDYYSIDTHDMTDKYWDDTDDNGYSAKYNGNFYADWQTANTKGVAWFENKNTNGDVAFGEHNTQHITANRKAYAMWWILARIAGWDGVSK